MSMKPAAITTAPPPRESAVIGGPSWRERVKEAAARIVPNAPPSDPHAEVQAGEIPPGGGSTPIPDDPAVTDPLGHLEDLPGVSEEPPTPGEGLTPTDEIPPVEPPVEPPPPPAPPPVARNQTKGM